MKRLIFIGLFVCAFVGQAFAGTQNFITAGTTTHSYTGGDSGHEGSYGIDENFSTYHGMTYYTGGGYWGGSDYREVISEHTFTSARNITSIKYRIYARSSAGGPGGDKSYLMYVQYKSGGTWTDIFRQTGGDGSPGEVIYDTGTITYSTPLSNVTAIKAYCYAYGSTVEGFVSGDVFIYEIEAFGTAYDDIGIRIKGPSATYKIGTETLTSTHKLRVRKGSMTYGIPLLATTDSDASPVRIYDGSAVKALPKTTE